MHIFMIMISLWFIGASTSLVSAQEKKLFVPSNAELSTLLDKGGKDLVNQHGEEMLEWMYWRIITKEMDDPSEPRLLRNKKNDLPVYRALKSGGDATIALLNRSNFFKYPRHFNELEVIAFLLFELVGHNESISIAEKKLLVAKNYEKANWVEIKSLLALPDLSSGFFYYETKKDIAPESYQITLQVRQIKEHSTVMDEVAFENFLAAHYKFHTIVKALLQYRSQENSWPTSLYLLTQKQLLDFQGITFPDSAGFLHTPNLLGELKGEDQKQKVLYLQIPDGKYIFEGKLDGSINVIK